MNKVFSSFKIKDVLPAFNNKEKPAKYYYEEQLGYLARLQTGSGAIRDRISAFSGGKEKSKITPYFANMAAIALTTDSNQLDTVKRYMAWYINHLNLPEKKKYKDNNLYGTIFDYYSKGYEQSTGDYDSVDSYAATFLSLARAYYQAGGDKTFLLSNAQMFRTISSTLLALMDSDSLTWAKPDYQIKYLMDNCEVYKGLKDYTYLLRELFNDKTAAQEYENNAEKVKSALLGKMRNNIEFFSLCSERQCEPVNWGKWYPDAVSQLYPILFEVIPPDHPDALYLVMKLNKKWKWPNFKTKDSFPWVLAGYVNVLTGNRKPAKRFYQNLINKYISPAEGTQKPGWYSLEAAWFVMMVNKMIIKGWL